MLEQCSTCKAWVMADCQFGYCCRRAPTENTNGCEKPWTRTQQDWWCHEYVPPEPSREVLETDLPMLQLTPATRLLCQKLHLHTVEEITLVGRLAFSVTGDRNAAAAIQELSRVLEKLGVKW